MIGSTCWVTGWPSNCDISRPSLDENHLMLTVLLDNSQLILVSRWEKVNQRA